MIFIGVDPGKSGGYSYMIEPCMPHSFYWNDGNFTNSMRILTEMAKEKESKLFCVVEKVHSMPKQGVKSTFDFGKSAGFIEGVLQSLLIPYQLVPPQAWKKEFNLIGTDKKASVAVAQKLFPKVNLLPTERSRVPSDGMAESLLLTEYARRIYKNE